MLHIQVNSLSEEQKTFVRNHIIATRPDTILVMNDLNYARSLKPYVKNIIYRDWGLFDQNNVWAIVSPSEWWAAHAVVANAGLWSYAENEAALSQQSIDWLYEICVIAIQTRRKVVIGNWAVGNPGHLDWWKAHQILKMANDHPELIVIGLHEYIPTLWTERYGKETNKELWGGINVPTSDLPWHIGRFRWLIKYCKEHNLRVRICFTEYGFDEVADVHEWQRSLPGYRYAMGLNNCLTAFTVWGGNPIVYAIASLYVAWDKIYYPFSDWFMGDPCIFTVAGNAWEDFDLLKTDIVKYLTKFKVKNNVNEGTQLVSYRIIHTQSHVNIRKEPTTASDKVGEIKSGEIWTVFKDSSAQANGLSWKRLGNDNWFALVPGLELQELDDVHGQIEDAIKILQNVLDIL